MKKIFLEFILQQMKIKFKKNAAGMKKRYTFAESKI